MSASHPPEPLPRGGDPSGAAHDAMAGRIFGQRYRVVRRLGEGGMGAVYLCEHVMLGRRFAVKVLRPDRASDPELRERFRNEALAAARIGQQDVVEVLDFGEEPDGALYYVMEALEGRSLGALIREEGPLSIGRTLALLEQVARALAAAHARGVVHRDVKPENVFVVCAADGTERAKVLDFGISHVGLPGGDRLTRAGSIIGTPEYMAPEQATGAGVDRRSDVYAVGVLAFEMLTGALPLVGETPIATLLAHQTQVPSPPSRLRAAVPPAVDALVLRALAKNPAERFGSMLDLAAELARLRLTCRIAPDPGFSAGAAPTVRFELDELPCPVEPPAVFAPAPPAAELPEVDVSLTPSARAPGARRARIGAAAAAIALLAVGAGWWWMSGSESAAATPTTTATPPPPSTPTPAAAPAAAAAPAPAAASPSSSPSPSPSSLTTSPGAGDSPAAPRPQASPGRAPSRQRPSSPAAEPSVKDPYEREDGLKPDPFR